MVHKITVASIFNDLFIEFCNLCLFMIVIRNEYVIILSFKVFIKCKFLFIFPLNVADKNIST